MNSGQPQETHTKRGHVFPVVFWANSGYNRRRIIRQGVYRMPKNPDLLIEQRREEILEAFLGLYENKNFNELNIKVIGEATRFTRTTLYNYFKNLDEIFMSAYRKEYLEWAKDLNVLLTENAAMTPEAFADAIATSLEKRKRMLRMSLENFHEKEMNCRREFVFSLKVAFGQTIDLLHDCIAKFFPKKSEEDIVRLLYQFFPYMHGIYRYVAITPLQREARDAAHILLKDTTVYALIHDMVLQLLK